LCGIATFTHDVCEAVSAAAPEAQCYAGAVNDREEGYSYPPRVRYELQERDLDSYRRAADFLNFNNADVLCVQHEFGIYGGPAGSHLLALLKEVRMSVVTTLHTVLQDPNPAQREVMAELIRRSDRLVVMARKGAEILRDTYGVSEAQVDIIPHGIPDVPFQDSAPFKARLGVEGRMVLLTFGLLGPGKGIEYAIQALPAIVKDHPQVVYLVLGATHPHLVAREGERYRLSLERLAEDLGVKDHVIFYNRFVSLEDLTEFIGASDIYLTPYLNEAQITSGTLAYVFGAGKAVVSTPYWHASELLAEGRGILVPFRDPQAIADGVCRYLDDPALLERTRATAYEAGRGMIWPAVAELYLASFQRARKDRKANPRTAFAKWTLANRPYDLPPLRLDHLHRMTDGTGIFQHAIFNVPNYHEGYCTDDNARGYVLCNLLDEQGAGSQDLDRLASTCLAFLAAAWNGERGRFRNFMSHGRVWLEEAGSEESHGRALWALGTGANRSRDEGRRRLCAHLFRLGLTAAPGFSSPRGWAFAMIGLHEFLKAHPRDPLALGQLETLTDLLLGLWRRCATEDWPWFEPSATYDNARLSQALLLAGQDLGNPDAMAAGLKTLGWLVSIQKTQAGNFRPIGSNGFYVRGGARADFDQQPVEALAMVAACMEAFKATGEPLWQREARRCFEWFFGRNDLGLSLYDFSTGGCSDGLHDDRVNENQGAESSLAFHLARAEMNDPEPLPVPTRMPLP
jgi:glycosyltransferase involved in cell wall biosynthesis